MAKYVEIGGMIKKGLSQSIVENFSDNKDIISIGYANGRHQISLIFNSLVMPVKLKY